MQDIAIFQESTSALVAVSFEYSLVTCEELNKISLLNAQ